jgi:hypothetical protein
MQMIHDLIRSGAPTSDDDILTVIRNDIAERPTVERSAWLRQLELSLDGYGGALSQRADRIRTLLNQFEAEMHSSIGR